MSWWEFRGFWGFWGILQRSQQNGWTLEGQPVKLSYPECSAVEQVKDGASVGAAFLLLLASIYAFRLLVGFVKDFGRIQGDS